MSDVKDARVEAAALEIYRRTGLDMTMELCRELVAPVLAAADAVGGEAVAGSARGFAEWIKSQPADREPTTLDEALSEYLRTHPATVAPAVPEGWSVEKEGDTIKVAAPIYGPGVIVVSEQAAGLAQRMLYALCNAMLAAARTIKEP